MKTEKGSLFYMSFDLGGNIRAHHYVLICEIWDEFCFQTILFDFINRYLIIKKLLMGIAVCGFFVINQAHANAHEVGG